MQINQNVPLLVIDVQKAFEHPSWGKRNNLSAEENIATLIKCWNDNDGVVIYVKHLTENKDSLFYHKSESSEFRDMISPEKKDIVITKNVNSAFIGTDLEETLRKMDCKSIVITGLTTNHCVETTTRMAGNLGFHPVLVSDATATFERTTKAGLTYSAQEIHEMTLVNLEGEFAEIKTTEEILQEMTI